ncbi:hypothetical protein L198_04678 [Cryptococcus wingfieldii CBS 7118]|uniref:Transcription factor CBF/NF-Y/archaeal histone domain-containing protein n=1 Tax=Cryptococcus wingfieldii CBS 7118 TaxID=1295528 RepID=A0A1E3J364_9TREE|nr:hypothetical protein L198_04678 [Cryptococcus wingfieldii CBS 7118]ODN95287.1 hypothetical protein L198_04678 [Cryptococcus wingfieldii CBS 7118]
MQVEYESSPAVGEHQAEESFSFRPGNGAPESEEEEAEDHEAGGEGSKKTKTKRVIKQRQSLAEKQPGTTMFPISKVKKIVKADRDVDIMSSEAVFMCAIAAEYFIKHFMEEGYTKARLEKRKIINYKDMANVVARNEEFDFLKGKSNSTILLFLSSSYARYKDEKTYPVVPTEPANIVTPC